MEWKDVANWLWAALLIPLGILWRKADNAVQKEEFERNKQTVREDIRQLYQNAEKDRQLMRDGFDRLSAEIHEVHVSMLNKLGDK